MTSQRISANDPGRMDYIGDGEFIYVYTCSGYCGCEYISRVPLHGEWMCSEHYEVCILAFNKTLNEAEEKKHQRAHDLGWEHAD